REAARRNLFAAEHADQAVVASAAAETAGKVRHGYFHDGAGVVRQAARQARDDLQVPARRRLVREREDRLEILAREAARFGVGRQREIAGDILERAEGAVRGVRWNAASGEIPRHAVAADLVQLVDRDQRVAVAGVLDAGRLEHRGQQLPVI